MTMRSVQRSRAGFSLVEVVLSLGIVVFCLTALTGLLIVGISGNKASGSETAATTILAGVVADLRTTSTSLTTSPLYSITIPAVPMAASGTTTSLYVTADGAKVSSGLTSSTYLVTVTFLSPGGYTVASSARTCSATLATISVSWPAGVPATSATGSVKTFIALDRN